MAKDYHKGYRLQIYIPEELNEEINDAIDCINKDRAIYSDNPNKYTRTKLVTESIKYYLELLRGIN